MPGQDDRIRCRYCGSNNFAGTSVCWQCNRPLAVSQSPLEPSKPVSAMDTWGAKPETSAFVRPTDTSTADKAAIWLGLLFPIVGYPIGIVFMMLDDPRKTQLGRIAILWSTIGLVTTFVASLLFIGPLVAMGEKLIPTGSSMQHLSIPTDDGN